MSKLAHSRARGERERRASNGVVMLIMAHEVKSPGSLPKLELTTARGENRTQSRRCNPAEARFGLPMQRQHDDRRKTETVLSRRAGLPSEANEDSTRRKGEDLAKELEQDGGVLKCTASQCNSSVLVVSCLSLLLHGCLIWSSPACCEEEEGDSRNRTITRFDLRRC